MKKYLILFAILSCKAPLIIGGNSTEKIAARTTALRVSLTSTQINDSLVRVLKDIIYIKAFMAKIDTNVFTIKNGTITMKDKVVFNKVVARSVFVGVEKDTLNTGKNDSLIIMPFFSKAVVNLIDDTQKGKTSE